MNYNTIFTAVNSMRQEAIEMTDWGTKCAIVWEQVADLIIEVFADASSIEYVVKADDEVFVTSSIKEFTSVLEYAFDSTVKMNNRSDAIMTARQMVR